MENIRIDPERETINCFIAFKRLDGEISNINYTQNL